MTHRVKDFLRTDRLTNRKAITTFRNSGLRLKNKCNDIRSKKEKISKVHKKHNKPRKEYILKQGGGVTVIAVQLVIVVSLSEGSLEWRYPVGFWQLLVITSRSNISRNANGFELALIDLFLKYCSVKSFYRSQNVSVKTFA